MGFANIRELSQSLDDDGANWLSFYHKTSGPSSAGAGRWNDLSMGAGTPKYNAYVGSQATATPFTGAGNDGIYLGPTPGAGKTRHLTRWMLQHVSSGHAPALYLLMDYLLHYPLIDGDSTDQQDLDNTLGLTRYADGEGVRIMAVCTTPMTVNATLTVSYTNQAGVAGRTSASTVLFNAVVGCIVSSSNTSGAAGSASPFLPLADGDTGVRSIQSATLTTGAGGFFALVLVKPLAQLHYREQGVAVEVNQFMQRADLPRIYDGAYLNMAFLTGQTGTPQLTRGFLEFAWR